MDAILEENDYSPGMEFWIDPRESGAKIGQVTVKGGHRAAAG
jgi:hypothetical protein